MRLAFLQDSPRQLSVREAVPAINLFASEVFVLAREYLETHNDLRIVVVSAKYGFISSDLKIAPYGDGLTYEKVDKFRPAYKRQWQGGVSKWFRGVDDLFVGLDGPSRYAAALMELFIHFPPRVDRYIDGGVAPGPQLNRWLNAPLGGYRVIPTNGSISNDVHGV